MKSRFSLEAMRDSPSAEHTSTVHAYSHAAVVVHWFLAAALPSQLALRWWTLQRPEGPSGLRAAYINLHKCTGLTIAAIDGLRRDTVRAAGTSLSSPPAWSRS